ncbi:MAG: hypothetical protein WC285_01000 [Candidatus Gracilibacteria bacterium]|jgi:hypothetical protein
MTLDQDPILKALEDDAEDVADGDRGAADRNDLPKEGDKPAEAAEAAVPAVDAVDSAEVALQARAQAQRLEEAERQSELANADKNLEKSFEQAEGGSVPADSNPDGVYDLSAGVNAPKAAESKETEAVAQAGIADEQKAVAERTGNLIKEGADEEKAA